MFSALIHRDCITITVIVLLLALLCCCLVMTQTLANCDIIVLMLASISKILSNIIENLLCVVVVQVISSFPLLRLARILVVAFLLGSVC